MEPAEVVVTLSHPHGEIETTLDEWMKTGPGPRPLICPVKAGQALTGEPMSLGVVPFRYRNNTWTRLLIRLHMMNDPWKRT